MVKFIVLESNIQSVTEFKQIIGRGTRIREAEGKVYFTIMDFRKARMQQSKAVRGMDSGKVKIYRAEQLVEWIPKK